MGSPTASRVTLKQAEIARLIRAAQSAGLEVAQVEIGPDGRVIVRTGAGAPADSNDWDEVLNEVS